MTEEWRCSTPYPKETVEAAAKAVKEIGPVAKQGSGSSSGRRIDDVVEAIRDHLSDNGLFLPPGRIANEQTWEWSNTRSGAKQQKVRLTVEYTLFGPDGWVAITGVGEGIDTQDKSVGIAQSYAFKYALLHAFMIPVREKLDPEDRIDPSREREATIGVEQQQQIREIMSGIDSEDGKKEAQALFVNGDDESMGFGRVADIPVSQFAVAKTYAQELMRKFNEEGESN